MRPAPPPADGSSWPRPAPGRTKELRYDGHVYASADHAPSAAAAPADRAPDGAVASAADAEPAPKGGRYPTEAWKAPVKFAQLSPAEQASILTAGGFKRDGKAWKGCEGSSSVDKDGVEIKDLNGDGRPEAVITDSSTDCYGMPGRGSPSLRAVPGGWKTMAQETGIPMFLEAARRPGLSGYRGRRPRHLLPGRALERTQLPPGHGARYDDDGKGRGKPCKL